MTDTRAMITVTTEPGGTGAIPDELLLGTDAQFVANAYRRLLGREPDPEGLGNWVGELQDGSSRWRVLVSLVRSPEAAERGLDRTVLAQRVLAAEARRESLEQPVAESAAQLLGWADVRFVRGAYLAILGRPADPGGLATYLADVRAGASKSALLVRMRQSPEGRSRSGPNPQILGEVDAMVRRQAMMHWPIVGPVLCALCGWERDDETARSLRRVENLLAVLAEDRLFVPLASEPPVSNAPVPAVEPEAVDDGRAVARPAGEAAARIRTLPSRLGGVGPATGAAP